MDKYFNAAVFLPETTKVPHCSKLVQCRESAAPRNEAMHLWLANNCTPCCSVGLHTSEASPRTNRTTPHHISFPYLTHHATHARQVWCAISNASAVFEDRQILAEAQRRLRIAANINAPFFLAV